MDKTVKILIEIKNSNIEIIEYANNPVHNSKRVDSTSFYIEDNIFYCKLCSYNTNLKWTIVKHVNSHNKRSIK